jgi:surfactin synthase thioesterase subunit
MSNLVECHSDYTYAERPVALTWEGQRLEIAAILAEWRRLAEKHFRVRTQDGQHFELSYSEQTGEWQIYQL